MEYLVIAITATKVVLETKDGNIHHLPTDHPLVKDIQVGDRVISDDKDIAKASAAKVKTANKAKGAGSGRGCAANTQHLRNSF